MAEAMHYTCPTCGSDVQVGKPCPGCPPAVTRRRKRLKKEQVPRSWEQDPMYDGLDLPEDEDGRPAAERGFAASCHRRTGLRWHWWALAAGLLAGMILGLSRLIPFWF